MTLVHEKTGKEFTSSHIARRIGTVRRNVLAWVRAVDSYLRSHSYRLVMIRLSYHYGEDWRPNAINGFVRRLHKELRTALLGYEWVAELQQRGVIHYHMLVLVKRGTKIEKPDDAGWWSYGSTRIETARSPYYLCTYTGKEYQKNGKFPKNARVCGGYIRKGLLSFEEMREYKIARSPAWVREARAWLIESGAIESDVTPQKKNGKWVLDWLSATSPWHVEGFGRYSEKGSEDAEIPVRMFGGLPEIEDHWYFADGCVPENVIEKASAIFEEWQERCAKYRLESVRWGPS